MLSQYFQGNSYFVMMLIGGGILAGWLAGLLCRRFKIPMVVGYIIVGIVLGKSFLGLFNEANLEPLAVFTYIALALIGFDIGGELVLNQLKYLGRSIIWISILESVAAALLVTLAVTLYTGKLYMGVVFGALASATAPAATVDVLREYQASGPLTSAVFAVVGIDDAIAVIIYAFAIFFAKLLLAGGGVNPATAILKPTGEIVGAIGLGFAAGLIFLFFTRHYTARRGLLVLAWGTIIFLTGLANLLHFSLILANMALGLTIVNVTKWRRNDIFEPLRGVTQPFFVIFFVLVGSELQIGKLMSVGMIGLLYIVFRSIGKQGGATLGSIISDAPAPVRKYMGLCLFSQAGVAIGLSLQTMLEFGRGQFGPAGTELGVTAISVIAATTLVFQLVGPPLTRYAVIKAGEANI
ncbi:MAG: cation:proton antiporter [Candidatus Geothermincolia bacterium]